MLSSFAKSSTVSCLLYRSTSAPLLATSLRWSPKDIYRFALYWTKPLIAPLLAAIIALHSAQFPLLWYSSRPFHRLKLWVSPLPLTSFNEPNSLFCLWVNALLPIRYQPSCLTSATTRYGTPFVLTCDRRRLDGPPCCNFLADPTLCFVALDNYPVFHDPAEMFSKSAESRIETRTLLRKELSKNLNLNSFDRIPMVGQSPLLYSLLALVDRQLAKCGRSAISFQTSRCH